INDISAFYTGQITADFNFSAAFFSNVNYLAENLLVDTVNQLLRSTADKMHTHFCTAVHPGIAHIIAHVTGEYYFDISQRFIYMFLDSHHIGNNLSRMI